MKEIDARPLIDLMSVFPTHSLSEEDALFFAEIRAFDKLPHPRVGYGSRIQDLFDRGGMSGLRRPLPPEGNPQPPVWSYILYQVRALAWVADAAFDSTDLDQATFLNRVRCASEDLLVYDFLQSVKECCDDPRDQAKWDALEARFKFALKEVEGNKDLGLMRQRAVNARMLAGIR